MLENEVIGRREGKKCYCNKKEKKLVQTKKKSVRAAETKFNYKQKQDKLSKAILVSLRGAN